MPSSLSRNDRGATAIEYAIIAGLIGLGLVGSLASTRESLRSVFGIASGNLDSATFGASGGASAATLPTPTATTAAYWSRKTLVSTTTVTSGKKFTYSDGSSATYSSGHASPFNSQLVIDDPSTNQRLFTWTNAAGTPTLYEIEYHNFGGLTGPRSGYDCSAPCSNSVASTFSGDPPLPSGMVIAAYNSSGYQTSYQTTTPTAGFSNMAAVGYYNYQYFKSLSGQ